METVQKFGALDAKKQVSFNVKKYKSHLQTKVVCWVSASILIVFNRRGHTMEKAAIFGSVHTLVLPIFPLTNIGPNTWKNP